ncbi:putative ECF-type RNA polymerase sigma factor [Bacteroides sp. CAG:530]|nr:putative ECF-type RNA polymerase sigma factor [Bacteroides sp. CAG:530]
MEKQSSTETRTFTSVYMTYFPKLVRFAHEYVMSYEDAENIVQDVFLHLWEQREVLDELINLNAWLFTMTKNKCIDYYRHKSMVDSRVESLDRIENIELKIKIEALMQFDEAVFDHEIEHLLREAINHLPEKCRQVFILSRMNGLRHDEIAERLNISVRTVQNHIVSALSKFRVELKEYLPLILFLTFF